MEVKASGTFDYKTIQAFMRLCFFGSRWKTGPKKKLIIYSIIYAVLALAITAEIVLLEFSPGLMVLLLIIVFLLLWMYFMYFAYPKIHYHALGKMKNITNNYVFTDDTIHLTAASDGYFEETTIRYSYIVKVIETPNYLYIFQTKTQAHIIEKSTITNGTIQDIRQKLSAAVSGKYIFYYDT